MNVFTFFKTFVVVFLVLSYRTLIAWHHHNRHQLSPSFTFLSYFFFRKPKRIIIARVCAINCLHYIRLIYVKLHSLEWYRGRIHVSLIVEAPLIVPFHYIAVGQIKRKGRIVIRRRKKITLKRNKEKYKKLIQAFMHGLFIDTPRTMLSSLDFECILFSAWNEIICGTPIVYNL